MNAKEIRKKIGAKCPQVLQKIGAKCIWAKRLGAEYLLARRYNKGSCTYYVITFGGPETPLPPLCNIVIIWAYPPLCNTVINWPYPPYVKL